MAVYLDDIELPGAFITNIQYAKKLKTFEPEFSDVNYVEECGQGITRCHVKGICITEATRDAIITKCMATGTKQLLFPTAMDGVSARYFLVYTLTPTISHLHGMAFDYDFECYAADPFPYDVTTGLHVFE